MGILIVDDNASNLEVLRAILVRSGHLDIREASNGRECIEFCKKQKYACIFMDLRMPDINGYEASAWIRENENPNQKTPIIAFTTYRDCLNECLEAGMQKVLHKLVPLKTIQDTLEEYKLSPVLSE